MFELRHLRYFMAVAEELSFTSAARRLNLSQPPLSQQIRQFEDEIGTALFKRSSRRVELTPAGTAMLARARAILGAVEQASEEARVIGLGHVGILDIGMTGSILLGPLAPLVRVFSATYPKINVRLHELSPSEQHAALIGRRTDISFVRQPPDDDDLVTELGWAERIGVTLPLAHTLVEADRISLSDLKDESHVFLHLGTSRFAQYLWYCCVEAGFTPRVSQQVVESYSLISLVGAGFGVAVVPERIQTLAHPGVVHRPLHGTRAVADVMMIYRPDPNAVLTTFLKVTRGFLASQLPFQSAAGSPRG